MKNRKKIIALCGLIMVASVMPSSAVEANKVIKLAGRTRVETSAETANLVKSKILILANGYSFADSLSAQNVANKTGGKVQLVSDNTDIYSLYKNTWIEKIYIVGGAVSERVIQSASKLQSNIRILNGVDRYDTNKKTLSEFGFTRVGVADGRNFPDALSASPLLKKKGLGLKLVNGSRAYILGEKVEYTFGEKDSVKQDGGKRLAGRDRYATNNKINEEIGRVDTVTFVNGQNFPDALSAVNVTTVTGASVVLMGKNGNDGAKNYVRNAKRGYIVGNEVSQASVNSLIGNNTPSPNPTPIPTPNPTPNPNPNPKPNQVKVSIYNAVTNEEVSSVMVDKSSEYEKAKIPNGYKLLPNQKINKDDSVFRLYVVPESYTVIDSMEVLDTLSAKSVVNQMEEKKNIVFTVKSEDVSKLNLSQDNYSGIKPYKTNAFLWPMGFSVELASKGEYIEDNGIFIKSGDINYKITQAYWTGEKFDREKHKKYINKGIEALKSIGVYENNTMSDMEKARKISEWIWDNAVYSPVTNSNGNQEIERRNRSPYSILEFGEGICEGYSFTTSILFNIAGIKVNTMETSMHKWNNFYADGNWHKLDNTEPEQANFKTTWDNSYQGISNDTTSKGYSNKTMEAAYDFMDANGYYHFK